MSDHDHIAGIVLAGGLSSRMGGHDKSAMVVAGKPMLARVVERLGPQVGSLAINAGAGAADFALVPDRIAGHKGPLAGIAAGLAWAAEGGRFTHLATAACDTPFFPLDLVARLWQGRGRKSIVMARTGTGIHPTFALWPVALAGDLETHLLDGGSLRVLEFARSHGMQAVDFPVGRFDPFFNVNTPDDVAEAEEIARRLDP